jgi:tRNA 2-thiouridine synthesizing protein C
VAESGAKKRHLLVIRRAPYGSSLARAAVDLGLAMGAFEQEFDLLFLGDGVLQLLQNQDSEAIGRKNLGKVLSSLPLYDVESVYVDATALSRHGIKQNQLLVPATALDDAAIRQLLTQCDHLVSC